MTTTADPERTDLPRGDEGGRSRSGVAWALNALGVVVVGFWFVRNGLGLHHPAWVWAVGGVALAAWVVREVTRSVVVVRAAAGVMIVAGSLVVVPTDALMVVPVVVGVVLLGASTALPVWVGGVAALVGMAIVAGSAAVLGASVQFVLGASAGLLLGVLVGFGRRQLRVTELRSREVLQEQQRAALLADRSRAARDVHDVLAHSLGGLVLQLDAVEALLEAGRVDEAARRAGEARTLAADGLAEARRAVRALRDDTVPTTDADATDTTRASRLSALLDDHRSFGGSVTAHGTEVLDELDAAHRAAVVQIAREALSNARRHAPGRPVALEVVRDGSAVSVTIANPLGSDGHGITGMRERAAELGDGSTVEAGVRDGAFVVVVHLPAAVPPEGRP
ncbi:histidine kinase [Curtobacterium sp. DN_7.5]|uniref:sensor histidine kinase n=1 Tax=Curtobacterium sp. DN_7.5 TaxID=3049047 RepID=UPI001F56CE1F|nr:histidine kinase [Curtobacterium sp. DN_7.5]